MRKYTDVYKGEEPPKRKDVLWAHHSVKDDLTSPVVVQIFSKGKWVDAYDGGGGAEIERLSEDLGDITELKTTDKDNTVDAINEVVDNVGDLSDLTTTAKTDLVSAINEASTTGDPASLLYTAQSLTEAQKTQALTNIGAASQQEFESLNAGEVVPVTELPNASNDTMGKVYLVGPDANDEYDRYVSSYNGTNYSWVQIGTTQMDLSGYATDAEVSQLEAKLTEMQIPVKYTNGYIKTSDPIGTIVDINNYVSLAPWMCYVTTCKEGDTVIVSGSGGQSPRLWAFLDEDYRIILQSSSNATANGLTMTAPQDAAWVIVNDNSGKLSYLVVDANLTDIERRLEAQDEKLLELEAKVYESQNTQDAEVHQVNTSSTTETTSGTRLRLLYYVKPGYIISASCSLGSGVGAGVYSNKTAAIIASADDAIQVIQDGYAESFFDKTITAEGYLCLSLKKADGSSFSAQEKADFLAATNVSLLTTPLSETVQNLQKEVGGSYDKSDFTIVRVETGTEALVDSPNGTRLRCILQVKQGDSFSLKTTDPGGIYVGVYDTIPHAVRAATGTGSGLIQIITNGYVTEQVSGEILEEGYLSVSLTNESTAISDSRKQEMIDSLSFFVGGGLTYKVENTEVKIADVSDTFGQPLGLYVTPPFMKGVNHRGYSVGAPENTLPAYVLSYKHGFRYVECDIAFTADGVPVLLHDATIDRTSDGTGNIGNLTYEQVLQYDFGSWFSPEFAGTKIPTLAEFLSLCRNLGLHPFLEIKSSASYTTEQIHEIVDLVEVYGMKGNVTYLSFNSGYLSSVVSYDESADVMLVVYSISDSVISTAQTLRTGRNIVSIGSQTYTSSEIDKCRNSHFPLGVWTIDSAQTIASLDPYISAVTSNSQNAMLIKLTNELS